MSDENVVGRDELQRMLRDAENGRFDCLLVWEIDRFGRERQDIPTGKMTLKRAGVKPHIDLLQYQRKRTALACSSAVQMSMGYEKDGFVFLIDGFEPPKLTNLSHSIQHCPEANHPNNE